MYLTFCCKYLRQASRDHRHADALFDGQVPASDARRGERRGERHLDPAEVEEILDLLGLTERRHHLPNQLSGGQQQRVAIGRALITKPKLILADEPTGNLDSKNSQDVMALLTQASRRYQQTILMITHNKNLTASVDRVFRVSDGVLTDLGGKKNEALS